MRGYHLSVVNPPPCSPQKLQIEITPEWFYCGGRGLLPRCGRRGGGGGGRTGGMQSQAVCNRAVQGLANNPAPPHPRPPRRQTNDHHAGLWATQRQGTAERTANVWGSPLSSSGSHRSAQRRCQALLHVARWSSEGGGGGVAAAYTGRLGLPDVRICASSVLLFLYISALHSCDSADLFCTSAEKQWQEVCCQILKSSVSFMIYGFNSIVQDRPGRGTPPFCTTVSHSGRIDPSSDGCRGR